MLISCGAIMAIIGYVVILTMCFANLTAKKYGKGQKYVFCSSESGTNVSCNIEGIAMIKNIKLDRNNNTIDLRGFQSNRKNNEQELRQSKGKSRS